MPSLQQSPLHDRLLKETHVLSPTGEFACFTGGVFRTACGSLVYDVQIPLCAFSPCGRFFAFALLQPLQHPLLRVVDLTGGAVVFTLPLHVRSMAYAGSGELYIVHSTHGAWCLAIVTADLGYRVLQECEAQRLQVRGSCVFVGRSECRGLSEQKSGYKQLRYEGILLRRDLVIDHSSGVVSGPFGSVSTLPLSSHEILSIFHRSCHLRPAVQAEYLALFGVVPTVEGLRVGPVTLPCDVCTACFVGNQKAQAQLISAFHAALLLTVPHTGQNDDIADDIFSLLDTHRECMSWLGYGGRGSMALASAHTVRSLAMPGSSPVYPNLWLACAADRLAFRKFSADAAVDAETVYDLLCSAEGSPWTSCSAALNSLGYQGPLIRFGLRHGVSGSVLPELYHPRHSVYLRMKTETHALSYSGSEVCFFSTLETVDTRTGRISRRGVRSLWSEHFRADLLPFPSQLMVVLGEDGEVARFSGVIDASWGPSESIFFISILSDAPRLCVASPPDFLVLTGHRCPTLRVCAVGAIVFVGPLSYDCRGRYVGRRPLSPECTGIGCSCFLCCRSVCSGNECAEVTISDVILNSVFIHSLWLRRDVRRGYLRSILPDGRADCAGLVLPTTEGEITLRVPLVSDLLPSGEPVRGCVPSVSFADSMRAFLDKLGGYSRFRDMVGTQQ